MLSTNDERHARHCAHAGLQRYIDAIRQGMGQNPKQYSARYICSLVGDFHRTLLYGGGCGMTLVVHGQNVAAHRHAHAECA